jgi:hypothetical protein
MSEPHRSDRTSNASSEKRDDAQHGRERPRSFFWPLLLVGIGVVLLLANLCYLPWDPLGFH